MVEIDVKEDRYRDMYRSRYASMVFAFCIVAVTAFAGRPSFAATNGGKCSKAGITQNTKGVTYKCSKIGKSLKWVKSFTTNLIFATTSTIGRAEPSTSNLLFINHPSPQIVEEIAIR